MKAFAYLRVSSKDQVKGTSLTKQLEICRIIARNLGIPDPDIYEEPGISAETIKKRPVFVSLLREIRAGAYDNGLAIAFDQDRLTRRTMDWARITDLFKEHNIRLHTSQGVMDFSKRDQRLTSNIKGSISQWELETIRERTLDGKRRKMLEGYWTGGPPLWGYRYDASQPKGQRLRIDSEQAQYVRLMLIDLQDLSSCDIAQEMNRRAIASPRGGLWNSNKVVSFFDDDRLLRYSGQRRVFYQPDSNGGWERVPEGLLVKAKWDPIITEEERIRAVKKKNQWRKHRSYPTRANKLITGLGIAFCGYCGASVATTSCHQNRNGSLRAYYGCTNRSCPDKPKHRVENFDKLILDAIRKIRAADIVEGYNYFLRLRRKESGSQELPRLEAGIDLALSQRDVLVTKVSSGLLRDDEARSVLGQLRDRLVLLQKKKETILAKSDMKFLDLVDVRKIRKTLRRFDELPFEQRKLGIKALVRNIKVFKERLEVELNFPITEKAKALVVCPVSSTGKSI